MCISKSITLNTRNKLNLNYPKHKDEKTPITQHLGTYLPRSD